MGAWCPVRSVSGCQERGGGSKLDRRRVVLDLDVLRRGALGSGSRRNESKGHWVEGASLTRQRRGRALSRAAWLTKGMEKECFREYPFACSQR